LFAGALIHALLVGPADRWRISAALHQRALAGDRKSRRADDGLVLRNAAGTALVYDPQTEGTKVAGTYGINPPLMGRFTLADGRKVVTSFTLVAERFLSKDYAPEAVSAQCGVPAATIRRIAAELAHTAFEEADRA
jgi:anaerobic selenocysteine-containing dehydrogenase